MRSEPVASPWWVTEEYAAVWAAYIAWKELVEAIFFPPLVMRRPRDLE